MARALRRSMTMGAAFASLAASIAWVGATPAAAFQTSQPNVVSAVPYAQTPDVNNGVVYAIGQVGTQMFLGGSFTSISPHATPSTTYADNYIASFNATTGVIDTTGFLPTINGQVETIIPGPAANEVYVGGDFTTVDGVSMRIALLNTTTGALVPTWKPAALNGAVLKVVSADGVLFVGGQFTTAGGQQKGGLVALNPTTGAVANYATPSFTGHHNYGTQCNPTTTSCATGGVGPKALDVTPDGTRMAVVGNFTSAGGLPRDQVAVLNLTGTAATVDPNWATDAYTAQCFSGAFDSYIRDVQFSPDGSYFVIAATGGSGTNSDGTNSSCDTASRYETNTEGSDVRPTWIDYTGQDTFWTCTSTTTAVYCGGHERWVNNSHGYDYAGPGAVPRPGIAALDPVNGMPLSWNPGRNPRGAGAYALLATPSGLWVGSDTTYIGDHEYYHGRVAFFPLAGGETLAANSTPTLPGRVYTAGAFANPAASNVLYRIDAGGPTIPAIDNGPDWQADQTDPSPYRNSGSNTASYAPLTNVDSSVPASTPLGIFSTERWDPGSNGDGGEMHWAFPVPAGDVVDVRLYFANRYTGTSQVGQRVFDVAIDGQTFLNHYDIVASAGDQTGTMQDETVTSDGEVDIDFTHEVENPLIDGIEIVKESAPTTFPTPIYRINGGGEKIPATDGVAADWLADNANTSANGNAFRSGSANAAPWGEPWDGTEDGSVPSYVPSNIFASEDWDSGSTAGNNDLHYQFPVAAGTPVDLHLFFANNCSCTSGAGQRIFTVSVDGQPVPALTNYDIVADVGNLVGTMKTVSVVAPSSGLITVDFTHGAADNPLINGIEVEQTGPSPVIAPTDVDQFTSHDFDGTTAGAPQTLSTGIPWGSIHGAFTVNGEVYYGKADGYLYERTFDGTTFGPEVKVDPYDDPYWENVATGSGGSTPDYTGVPSTMAAEMGSVTSMFFTNGRLYYTLSGSSSMYWRWFEPDSGVTGSDEFTTTDGLDWSDVAGAFLAGNTLYYADKTTGDLMSVPWVDGQASGTPTMVDDSTNWASRGMFMLSKATVPNQPPVASFTATCSTTSTACTFDATGSNDPDGSITDYAWTFGTSPAEHHPDATVFSHDFGASGTYTVSLTVTDNDGAMTTKTEQVVVGQSTPVPSFGGSTTACGPGTGACGTSATTVGAIPAQTSVGDALLMYVSWPNTATTLTAPAGWTLLGKDVSSPLESDVFYKAASAGDVGSTVSVKFAAAVKNSVTIADYKGADPTTIEASAKAADSSTASHVSPSVAVTSAGSLAVSYWTDKSSATTAWTAPAGVTARQTSFDTGGGYVTSLLADSGSTVPTGTYGGLTATTNAVSGKGASWTIVLAPAGTTAGTPTASFTASCTDLQCSVDGSGSSEPGGTIASYAWSFGDGTSLPASSSPTAVHTYGSAGSYSITLTVTDSNSVTASTTVTKSVAPAAQAIGFVGASTTDGSATNSAVTVPAGASTGDALLLFDSIASTTVTATPPAGWTLLGTTSKSNLTTAVYEKVATGSDAGSSVSIGYSAAVKASLTVADYTDTSGAPIEAVLSATGTSTTSHATPALSGLAAGSWVVSYWTDKSTTTSAWTAPAGVTQRAVVLGSGSAADSALLADSGGQVSGGYPAQTATSNVSSGSAAQWAIALSPGT